MLVEIDQVAVDAVLWQRIENGDDAARAELKRRIHGLQLYVHALPVAENEVLVTLRQLEQVNVLEGVRLETEPC